MAQQSTEVAYFETVQVKPGTEAQFEATLKRHWDWHKKQGERWTYFVWTIDTGKQEGAYLIASFGHAWKDVDESNALVSGTPDPEENPERFHLNAEEAYYRYRPDLSFTPRIDQPAPVTSVTHVVVKPGSIRDFEDALTNLNAARSKSVRPIKGRWYELVAGGDYPQFLLIEDRANWSSFGEQGQLDEILHAGPASPLDPALLNAFRNSIRSAYVDTLHYRPDLSRLQPN